ncbi:MAG: Ig-like domain-containing protein, partial [Planctomycetota bacterium]
SAVQVGGSVSQADVAAGHLTFAPEANWNGDTTIGFHAHDGTALSSNAGAFAIHVDPVNDAPTATDGSVSFNEDSSGAITLAGSDPDGTPIDHYVIDALPSHGTLLLNGSAVQVGGSVSQADVAAGHLTFTPEANWNGDTTIGFHAHDGTALSSNAGTFAIHVDPVDDPPAVFGGGGGAPPSTVSTGPDPAPTIGAQAGSSDHAAGDPTSVDGSLDEPVDQEPTDYQDDGVQVVDVLPPAPDQPPPAADDVQPLPVTDDVQSTPGHSGDAPASDAGSGSGTVSALHPGTSSPANSGYVVDRSGDAGSPGVKWSPNENIAVLNPLQHLGDSVEYNIGHAAPEAMPHAPIASGNELKDSTDHFVPTAVIEMEAPRPVTLAVDLVGIEPGQTVTDVFHEIAGGTSSHRELPGGQSVETNAAPAASSGRLTEDGAFELPGVMRSETPSDAVAAAPQYAELLDAGAAGFFAKLWAAIRGIGPSQPTNQANSGTERVGQRR